MMNMYQTEPKSSDLHAIGMYRPATVLLDRGVVQPEFVEYWFARSPGANGGSGLHAPIFPHVAGTQEVKIITRTPVTIGPFDYDFTAKSREKIMRDLLHR